MLPKESTVEQKDELVACDLCGNNDFTFLFNGHDYLSFSPLTFKVMRCNRCDLVSLNPRPENIADYYAEYRKGSSEKDIFEFLAPNRIKKIKKIKKSGRILDVGCGRAGFLYSMSKEGWEVYGNEISQDACNFARKEYGLKNIKNSDLLLLDFPENFFDVITLWHVLEHLEKPRETLEFISKILKDDGLLIIESPNFSSLQSRIFKDKWFSLDLPRHLYQFSPKVLGRLLKLEGFKIYKRNYIVTPFICFVSFKISLLRLLGVRTPYRIKNKKEPESIVNFRRSKILWKIAAFSFNLISLFFSVFLSIMNSDDSFRIYCKKVVKL